MTGFFEFAKTSDEPIVLHLLTQKEKVSPSLWKNLKSGMAPGPSILKQELRRKQNRIPAEISGCVRGMPSQNGEIANSKIVGITAAMPSGTGLDFLQKEIPDRFFGVGIAEEHAVLMAAGMATGGKLLCVRSTRHFFSGPTTPLSTMFACRSSPLPFV